MATDNHTGLVRPANRRGALKALTAGAAAAVVAPVAAQAAQVAPGADAALIALCDRFEANERHYLSFFTGGANHIEDEDEQDAAVRPIQDEQERLTDQIIRHRATTLEGFVAVARCLGIWRPDIREPEREPCIDQQLTAMLVRDARRVA